MTTQVSVSVQAEEVNVNAQNELVNVQVTFSPEEAARVYALQAEAAEDAAALSATQAASSASDALASEQAALASEQAALASEQAAAGSASDALASEQAAAISAGDAYNSMLTAQAQATIAANQAGIATTQAGIATTQAGIATTQAANALASANAAAASAASINVLGTVLTGFAVGLNTSILATDTVLAAFGKVQGQLNSKQDALGFTPVPTSRTLTINGTSFDLSADRSWTISAGIAGTIASGQVAFGSGTNTIGGSNNLFWDNTNGRLGIGTNSPANNLDIAGSARVTGGINASAANYSLTLTSTSGSHVGNQMITGSGVMYFGINNSSGTFLLSTNGLAHSPFITSTTTALQFGTNATARQTIFPSSGNIGINTTTDAGFRLDVNGTARVQGQITYQGALIPANAPTQYCIGLLQGAGGSVLRTYTNGGISPIQQIEFGFFTTSLNSSSGLTNPSHNNYSFRIYGTHVATGSGGGTYTDFRIAPTYNFTGNATAGTVFGISYEPTATNLTNTTLVAFRNTIGNNWLNTSGGNTLIGTTTDAGFRLDVNGTARVQGDFTISDTRNIILATGTGTKIGTSTSQKLSLWNATPNVQPTTGITAGVFVANTSGIANDTATFDGYTIGQVVAALRRIGALA